MSHESELSWFAAGIPRAKRVAEGDALAGVRLCKQRARG